MAIVEVKQTGERLVLHSQHTIGRHSNNISVVYENDVSRKHAIVHWENNSWFLTDFSSNGTKVNNGIVHHATQRLKKNDIIRFSNKPTGIWKLVKNNSPNSFLKSIANRNMIDLENGLMFSEKSSRFTLFRNKKQSWVMDDGTTEVVLRDGQTYIINNEEYIFVENECQNETEMHTDIICTSCFYLTLSNDEENIFARIKVNDMMLDLGDRSYNQLLLYLARARREDQEKGVVDESSGWVYIEQISLALSKEVLREVDEYYINNLIYRLRKRLFELPPCGPLFANIIERRKGKLRFGLSNFKIEKEHMVI